MCLGTSGGESLLLAGSVVALTAVMSACGRDVQAISPQQLAQQYGEEGSARRDNRLLLGGGGKALALRKEDQPFFAAFLLLITGLVVLIASQMSRT